MLYVVPIEPLEERYSAQWLKWTKEFLSKHKIKHKTILPNTGGYNKIQNGAFLDIVKTNLFKSGQLRQIMLLFDKGQVKNGDVFWFHDLWFPGLEMLFYIRNAMGINLKIFGCLHAGTYDPNDFLARRGMAEWAASLEHCWFNEVDGIFVATHYHNELLAETRIDGHNVYVTGFPFYSKDLQNSVENFWMNAWMCDSINKDNITVVFPHRLDPEKQPERFDQLAELLKQDPRCKNWKFIKTKEVCATKNEYYTTLSNSQIAVSFALQETWGIAMQEAVTFGAVPVVPDRLSYIEMYGARSFENPYGNVSVLYDGTVQGAAEKIKHMVFNNYPAYVHLCRFLSGRIEDRGFWAFPKMLLRMGYTVKTEDS